jgi:alpha-tubulin suppressor-like RCC1 family protein
VQHDVVGLSGYSGGRKGLSGDGDVSSEPSKRRWFVPVFTPIEIAASENVNSVAFGSRESALLSASGACYTAGLLTA